MHYKKILCGQSSVVGVGTWAMGGDFWGKSDDLESVSAIRTALDNGVNLIDTAPAYGRGHSEELVGQVLADIPRDKVLITTKCGILFDEKGAQVKNAHKDGLRPQLEQSLRRMKTDYADIYLLHWPDASVPIEETMEGLLALKKEGMVRMIGLCNADLELLQKAQAAGPVDVIQQRLSVVERDNLKFEPFCEENGIVMMAYASLAGGVLSGKHKERPHYDGKTDRRTVFYKAYEEPLWSQSQELLRSFQTIAARHDAAVSEVAINWVCHHPFVCTALTGMRNPAQAAANAKAGSWVLSEEEAQWIEREYERIFGEAK